MRRFYAPEEDFHDNSVTLRLDETRHLRDVLRLREGERVRIFDGRGGEFLCLIEQVAKKETNLRILESVPPASPESNLDLTLAVSILKGEKYDLVIQKAVELGARLFVPMVTRRCDVRLKDADKKLERWRKIVLEAAKQSGRAALMRVERPLDFEAFVENAAVKSQDGSAVLFAERGGEGFSAVRPAKKITAFIGSEGGWENFEIERAKSAGIQIVTLGGRILRAETAAVSIAAILQHRFGDLA